MRLRDIQMSEPSLTSLFEFTEASGNAVDSKGSVTGTASGVGIIYQRPPIPYDDPGYSVRFDNTVPGSYNFGDVWDIGTLSSYTFEFTLRYPHDITYGANEYLFGKGFSGVGGGYWCDTFWQASKYQSDYCAIRFRRWNAAGGTGSEIYSSSFFRPLEVNHIVISMDSSVDTIYLFWNGYLLTNGSGVMTQPNTSENFYLGAFQHSTSGGASQGTKAEIGNFAVYNNYMAPARVLEHYRAFLNPRRRVPIIHIGRDGVVDGYKRALRVEGDRRQESTYGVWGERSNFIANSNAHTNTTGWTNSGATVTRVTSDYAFGETCFKVDTDGSGANEGLLTSPRITFTFPGDGAVFSQWTKAPVGADLELVIEQFNSGGSLLATTTDTVTGINQWQRSDVGIGPLDATIDSLRLWVRTVGTQNIDFYVGGMQLELTEFGRLYPSPYLFTDLATTTREFNRFLLYDSDLPKKFYHQGWMVFKWRTAFDGIPVHGENMGFFQRGNSANRLTMYGNGYTVMYTYQAKTGFADTQTYGEVNFSSPWVKDQKLVTAGRWTPTTIASAAVNEGVLSDGFTDVTRTGGIPDYVAATGLDFADLYGAYQWFSMRPGADIFWMICGTGTLTDADVVALSALPDTPTPREVKSVLAAAAQPTLLHKPPNLFADILSKQSSYYRGTSRGIIRK